MNIDDMEGLDEETRKEIEELQKVTRKDHGDKKFASAQLEISNLLISMGYKSKAIVFLKKIIPRDDIGFYSFAQFLQGKVLYEKGNIDEALSILERIKRDDFPYIYCSAQFGIGTIYQERDLQNEALSIWSNIKQEDNPAEFAKAQYAIGKALSKANQEYEALKAFKKVKKLNNEKKYSQAQFQIGSIYFKLKESQLAIDAFNNVKKEYSKEDFKYAQVFTALLYQDTKQFDKALNIWSKVTIDSEFYSLARYTSGVIYLHTELLDYEKAQVEFKSTTSNYKYESYCYSKICELLKVSETRVLGEKCIELLVKTLSVIDILTLDFNQLSDTEKAPERKLAHYTGIYTIEKLLSVDKEKGWPSSFRLNTINNVNDPSEGQLLSNHLKGIKETSFYAPDFDDKLHAFISCFTFNHDSLNQFRLYGKQDNKEASGISLVFNQSFFQKHNSSAGLSYVAFENNLQKIDTISIQKSTDEPSKETGVKGAVKRMKEQPVMRCVYLDPTSSYVHLAQRNRLTFFREFGDEIVSIDGEEMSKAEAQWREYKNYIDQKTENFKGAFFSLKDIHQSIFKENERVSVAEYSSSSIIFSL